MKIGVTGAHNTGKTTLAKKLAKYYNLSIIPECARELLQTLDWNWREVPPAKNLLLETGIILAYQSYYTLYKQKDYVTDRLPIDVIAYTLLIQLHSTNDLLNKLRYGIVGFSVCCMKELAKELDLVIFLRDYCEEDSIAKMIDNYIASFIYLAVESKPVLELTNKKHYESIELVVPLINKAINNTTI